MLVHRLERSPVAHSQPVTLSMTSLLTLQTRPELTLSKVKQAALVDHLACLPDIRGEICTSRRIRRAFEESGLVGTDGMPSLSGMLRCMITVC